MSSYRAWLYSDPQSFLSDTVTVFMVQLHPSAEVVSALMRDGTWRDIPDGARLPEESGVLLPRQVIPALVQALAEWQGKEGHAATEVAVLREWLLNERERVDRFLLKQSEAEQP